MSTPSNDANSTSSQPDFYSPDYQPPSTEGQSQPYGSQQYQATSGEAYGSSNSYDTQAAGGYANQQTAYPQSYSYQQPAAQPYQQPYQAAPYDYYPVLADHPQATTILVLGILGVVGLPIVAPFAWVMGNKARKEIQQGLYRENGSITAGWVMGIIGSVLLGLAVLFLILYLLIVVIIIGAIAGS